MEYKFVGLKYTLHITDLNDNGEKYIIKFSDNELTNIIGVPFLAKLEYGVDEIVDLIISMERQIDLNKNISDSIIEKYGKCFWGDVFNTEQDYQRWLTDSAAPLIECNRWQEFDVTLIEVTDNNMWNCIVVLKNK